MQIRPPAVQGTFYPSDETRLGHLVDQHLARQPKRNIDGRILGLVVPHAGYSYSGNTAAAAYALLKGGDVETAVIVSPSHREYFRGVSVFEGDAYRTPLGLVEVDVPLRDRLLKHKGVLMLSKFGHREEHAIEVQLPFLQRINPDIRILPIVMGDQRGDFCMLLGELLRECAGMPGTVLIASTDLSHMYPDERAKQLDAVAREDISTLSSAALLQHLANGSTEACGGGPVCAVMHACVLVGADSATVLEYCTSGDVTGETGRVVGYLSAVFTQREQSGVSS